MPLHYIQDDDKRRIRLTLTDPTTLADLIDSVERQLTDGAWSYGSLIDARAHTLVPLSPSDMQAFA